MLPQILQNSQPPTLSRARPAVCLGGLLADVRLCLRRVPMPDHFSGRVKEERMRDSGLSETLHQAGHVSVVSGNIDELRLWIFFHEGLDLLYRVGGTGHDEDVRVFLREPGHVGNHLLAWSAVCPEHFDELRLTWFEAAHSVDVRVVRLRRSTLARGLGRPVLRWGRIPDASDQQHNYDGDYEEDSQSQRLLRGHWSGKLGSVFASAVC